MTGIETVVGRLNIQNIQADLWVDGSFVTEKIDPVDTDIVLRVDVDFWDSANQEQRDAIEWFNTDLKTDYHCDAYFYIEYPERHPQYWFGHYSYTYWLKQYGFSRADDMKGIVVVNLGASAS